MKQQWAGLLVAYAVCLAGPIALAQEQYPNREIHLICGFSAGSGADIFYRYYAEKLRALSGRPVIVENKSGAGGALALIQTAKAKPDGYTMSLGATGVASALQLMKSPGFAITDLKSLTGLLEAPFVLIVSSSSPFKTLPELTTYLKSKGNKASYGTATPMGIIVGELYKREAQLEAVQVNYKNTADSVNDLMSGNIDYFVADAGFTLGQMGKGVVRALALSTGNRISSMPGIPTMAELGIPAIDIAVWWAVLVPAATPKSITDKIDGWFAEIAKMPETARFLATNGTDVLIATPDQTRARLMQDVENWIRYVRIANIEPM